MLTAKVGDKLTWASTIEHVNGDRFSCIHCPAQMIYVSRSEPSGRYLRQAHFRHPAGASHPVRDQSRLAGDAIEYLVATLQKQADVELATDPIIDCVVDGANRRIPADLLITEYFPGGKQLEVVVRVESDSDGFTFAEFDSLNKSATQSGKYFLPILCASGKKNPNGAFYRDTRRKSGAVVKKLGDNERSLYERFETMTYFDHDKSLLKVVSFRNYQEQTKDVVRNGRVVSSAHWHTYTDFKVPEVLRTIEGALSFEAATTNRLGLPVVRPVARSQKAFSFEEGVQLYRSALAQGRLAAAKELEQRIRGALPFVAPQRIRQLELFDDPPTPKEGSAKDQPNPPIGCPDVHLLREEQESQ